MSKTPFMQLWVGDFMVDTMHLSQKEIGQYLLLLMSMWANGGSLPTDPKRLAAIARGQITEAVMEFFDTDDDGIYQKRLRTELKKAQSKHESRVICGKMGGEAKASKSHSKTVANPCHLSESESDTTSVVSSLGASRSKPRRRLAEDWRPRKEDLDVLCAEGFSLSEIQNQVPRFRDYWAGTGKPMADWDATFRNWVRKSAELGGRGPPKQSQVAAGFNRAFERARRHDPAISNQGNVVDFPQISGGSEVVSAAPCDTEPSE